MLFNRTGTPCTIEGSVLLVVVTRAVRGSIVIAARVRMVPKSNGPAAARTGIDNPNGPPPYGPVRKTGAVSGYGSGPAPAVTVAVPIWLSEEHVPCAACGSAHSFTFGIAPTSPAGSVVATFARYCCPSERARLNV